MEACFAHQAVYDTWNFYTEVVIPFPSEEKFLGTSTSTQGGQEIRLPAMGILYLIHLSMMI